ncbi:MAG: amidase [Anaerolineales bacterium]|nr:amidase [Anaerolineales bacterium]
MSDTPEEKEPAITIEQISAAEALIDLSFTDEERAQMRQRLSEQVAMYSKLRDVALPNHVPPAQIFDPRPAGMALPTGPDMVGLSKTGEVQRPDDLEDVAFWPVTKLARLIESRQVSSLELTEMYLARLKKYDPHLRCVVTLTEELARQQAAQADAEIAAGNYRGRLHGIPWGAKDLLAVKGYKTTWGAMPYKDQVINQNATVVERLNAAGAVLVAKLTTGALAYGDIWFDGKTKNPWDLEVGSSGSSAGPASAVAAGLVGFAIGSETLGSIVSPSIRCGTTGLRPTFGTVSRAGGMALSWTQDKFGPICRTVEDCAIIFAAIHGTDGLDKSVVDVPFNYRPDIDLKSLRIGYVKAAYEDSAEPTAHDLAALQFFRNAGFELIPIELPDYPYDALVLNINVEAAAAFDELTRSNQDDLLKWQEDAAWPNSFRLARFIPAVEYVMANRIRSLVIEEMDQLMSDIDLFICTPYGANNLRLTNFSGHPCVVLPNGLDENGTPTNIGVTITGRLYDEGTILAFARLYQEATGHHIYHPPMDY